MLRTMQQSIRHGSILQQDFGRSNGEVKSLLSGQDACQVDVCKRRIEGK
jgi:hypothetical protein